jgi:hypothetical protein
MNGTLQIVKNSFDCFPVALFGVLHESRNHTNNKGNSRLTMSKVNNIVDKVQHRLQVFDNFSKIHYRLKMSSTSLESTILKHVNRSITYLD